jgi:hypothetical protein
LLWRRASSGALRRSWLWATAGASDDASARGSSSGYDDGRRPCPGKAAPLGGGKLCCPPQRRVVHWARSTGRMGGVCRRPHGQRPQDTRRQQLRRRAVRVPFRPIGCPGMHEARGRATIPRLAPRAAACGCPDAATVLSAAAYGTRLIA